MDSISPFKCMTEGDKVLHSLLLLILMKKDSLIPLPD